MPGREKVELRVLEGRRRQGQQIRHTIQWARQALATVRHWWRVGLRLGWIPRRAHVLVELLEDKEAMQWVAQAAQEEARRQLDKDDEQEPDEEQEPEHREWTEPLAIWGAREKERIEWEEPLSNWLTAMSEFAANTGAPS